MLDKFKFSARVGAAVMMLAFLYGLTAYEVVTDGNQEETLVAASVMATGGAAVWLFPSNNRDDQNG